MQSLQRLVNKYENRILLIKGIKNGSEQIAAVKELGNFEREIINHPDYLDNQSKRRIKIPKGVNHPDYLDNQIIAAKLKKPLNLIQRLIKNVFKL